MLRQFLSVLYSVILHKLHYLATHMIARMGHLIWTDGPHAVQGLGSTALDSVQDRFV